MTGQGPDKSVERAPHPALRGLVTSYHGYHYAGMSPGVHHGLPSTELTLVISFDDPLDVGWMRDEASRSRHWVVTSGLHGAPALIHHDGRQHGIQLGLTPLGARVLLGMPAGGLAATMVPLGTLLGPAAERLYDEIAGAASWSTRFDLLDRHLLALTDASRPGIRGELGWAWRALELSNGLVRVEHLADEIGWSRRHFSSRFTDEFGLRPKQAARVLRFQHARALMLSDRPLAEVAAASGYADQAHLTREWRDLAGYTPTQWRREEVTFLQDDAVAG